VDEIFETLKEDIKYSDFMKNRLCNILTKKFIDGELCSGDQAVFKNEDELLSFINEALVYEDIKHLMELELVGYLDEDDDDVTSFFLTEKGKQYVEEMLKKKEK